MSLDEKHKIAALEDTLLTSSAGEENRELDVLPPSVISNEDEQLAAFPVVTTIPILWSDEDAFGHVNNLTYLRWCESSRVEYLQKVSMWTELPPSGAGPILASLKCDYKAQLKYPDTVRVGTRVSKIGNSSMRMEHVVVSREHGTVAAEVDSTIVFFDYERDKPVRIPAKIRQVIGNLEGNSCRLGK